MDELKIKRVWNAKAESFSPDDIDHPTKLAHMQASQPLWDENFNEVKIYPRTPDTRAHFKLKSGQVRSKGTRDDADPTHDQAVDFLSKSLANSPNAPEILGKRWQGSSPISVPLWSPHPSSDYIWYTDPSTQIAIEPATCIRPDIVGIDRTRLNRTATNPSIIIEVVHHHWPDESTWFNLVKLSRMNYLVVFYFVQKDIKISSLANSARSNEGRFTIVANHYLVGGTFYADGNPEADPGHDSTTYHAIENRTKKAAMRAFAKNTHKDSDRR